MPDSRFTPRHGSIVQGALAALLLSASPARALTLSTAAAADFNAEVAADSLGNPTDVAELPDGRIVVIEKGGNVKTFTLGTDEPPALDTITVFTEDQGEQGLLGIVADPDFATNQFIYIYASVTPDKNNRHKVLRYKLGADGKLGAMKPVIDMGLMGPANHNGGGLSIYGGNLYVGVGDTGKNSDIPSNKFASCLNNTAGKVLRVSLAEATLGQPPADNPLGALAEATGCTYSQQDGFSAFAMLPPEKRIYAWGFRNPFRVWADPVTGRLWVGDVGEVTNEEISVVDKGKHYGYPFWEGTREWEQAFTPANSCMGMTPASECVGPVVEHATDGGGAIMGGRILDGCGWPAAWKSRYIYGEHNQGAVWTVDVNDKRDAVVPNSRKDFASTNGVTAMHLGTDNALYIVERGAGRVTRITAKAAPAATPGSCPTTNPAPGGGGAAGSGAGGSAGAASGGQAAGGANNAGGSPSVGGANNPAAGTSSSSAGTANAGNASGSDGGCGCRLATSGNGALLGLGTLVAALGLALGRRRNRSQ